MYSLFLKEIRSFFNSLTGYIFIAIFLVINSLFMWVFDGTLNVPQGGYATMDTLFIIAPVVFLVLIPAITMRSFAEEKSAGTLQLLLTRPLTSWQIVTAKYAASFVLIFLALLPTLIYYISIVLLGNPIGNIDNGGTWGSYLGLLMLAAAYSSVGIFCSSLTDNLIISFILAVVLSLFICYGFDQTAALFSNGAKGNMLISLGLISHYESMSRGVIDTRDLVYFAALIIFFLILTKTILTSEPWLKTLVSVPVIIILAIILSLFHYRFDLTSEKRYTLSHFTRESLKTLENDVNLKIYLEGDLNIPFHKMQSRLKETLREFSVYSKGHLHYTFINPFKGKSVKESDKLLNDLVDKGLKPTNIIDKDEEGASSEKLIIPGLLLEYKNTVLPVNLLRNIPGAGAEENINRSVESFEFELMRAIAAATKDSTEKIAFLEGHAELNEYQTGDISNELGWSFQVDRGRINGKPGVLDAYKAVIIAGPTEPFNEQDKFVIDQYVMKGGNLVIFADLITASLDSISEGNSSLSVIRTLNIEDLLFRYGVRINPVLVQDIQCSMIPVNVALAGNPPDFRPAPWLYSPLLNTASDHPITRNINLVHSEFTGYIDTIAARSNLRKKVLLSTSSFSRIVSAPVLISLDEIRQTPRQEDFRRSWLPVAVLLEGQFESAFQNRMMTGIFPDTAVYVISKGKNASVLVVADADIIRNDIRPTPQGVLITPLGYDRYSSQTYGNKEFIVNAMQYITGHKGLLQLRSREIKLRLLDKTRFSESRTKWLLINTVIPVILVITSGLIYNWLRKRKYSRL